MKSWRRAICAVAGMVVALGAGMFLATTPAQAHFGIADFEVHATEQDGTPDLRAGSHPYALTTKVDFDLDDETAGEPGGPFTDGDLKDLRLELPPGLIEDPAAVPQCSLTQFGAPRSSPFEESLSGESCPDTTQVGVVTVRSSYGGGTTRTFGVFDLVPPPGAPSELGFAPFGVPITLTPHVRQAEGEYGITLESTDFPQLLDLHGFSLTLWGAPWATPTGNPQDPFLFPHDAERGDCLNEVDPAAPFGHPAFFEPSGGGLKYVPGTCSAGDPRAGAAKAYLTLPTSCAAPTETRLEVDSWQEPGFLAATSQSSDAEGHPTSLEACGAVGLAAPAGVQLTSERASSPSGFDFNLEPEDQGLLDPAEIAASPVRKAVVHLPEGMTINPSVGAGLGVCTPEQYAAETVASAIGAGCPDPSKIGDLTVESPLLESQLVKGRLQGSLFLAQPYVNPSHSLLAVYLVARSAERGILVKLAGEIAVDPQSGRLTATFDRLPQLPYTHLQVHFREGQRSPLATPAACGSYADPIELSSWPDPASVLHVPASFPVTEGPGGAACQSGAARFAPGAAAGTLNSAAGAYTPFYLHLTRTDTEAEITSYSSSLPPGLLAKIAGVPFCADSAIEAAKGMSGVATEAHPSCPAASQIGHTVTGFGVGGALTYAPGGLYLAGPYHGAPLSIVAIDAATVGPFDLGTIVVRSAVRVDPLTAQVSLDSAGSDPIPHIRDGIPLHLRDIRVYVDRPDFTVNPTSCAASSVISRLTGSLAPFSDPEGAVASPAVPFQPSDCSALGFRPGFALRLLGGARRGDFPALRAVYTPRDGDANLASATVTLPRSEFLEQAHIGMVCTRPRLEAATCPAPSRYGEAVATTPLLEEPMRGPVYLVSGFGHALPDLVADLRSRGVRILLDGRIDSHHGGIRATFTGLPDAPVSRFVMSLEGGSHGLLVNERDVCSSTEAAAAALLGQDQSSARLAPRPTDPGCRRHRRRPHHRRKGRPR